MEDYKVYMHTFPDGKRYIGIAKDTDGRWRGGMGYKREHVLMFGEIVFHGWKNILHEVLRDGLTQREAEDLEREYISLYESDNARYGYNLSAGVGTISERTRQKISEKLKGRVVTSETRAKLSASSKGRKKSAEHAEKIRLQRRKMHSQPVLQLDAITGDVICRYDSIAEAEYAVRGNKYTTIRHNLHGRTNTAYGYVFRFERQIEEA